MGVVAGGGGRRARVCVVSLSVVSLLSGLMVASAGRADASAPVPGVNPLRIFASGTNSTPYPQPWQSCVDPNYYASCAPQFGDTAMAGDGKTILAVLQSKAYVEKPSTSGATTTATLNPVMPPSITSNSAQREVALSAAGDLAVVQQNGWGDPDQTCGAPPGGNQWSFCPYAGDGLYLYRATSGSFGGGQLVNTSTQSYVGSPTPQFNGYPRPAGLEISGPAVTYHRFNSLSVASLPAGAHDPVFTFTTDATDLAGYGGAYPAGGGVFVKNAGSGAVQLASAPGGGDGRLTTALPPNNTVTVNSVVKNLNGIVWRTGTSVSVTPIADDGTVDTCLLYTSDAADE